MEDAGWDAAMRLWPCDEITAPAKLTTDNSPGPASRALRFSLGYAQTLAH
jgi:hypothetical protein